MWGADREVMTTDPCSGAFFGNVSKAAGTTLEFNMQTAKGGPVGRCRALLVTACACPTRSPPPSRPPTSIPSLPPPPPSALPPLSFLNSQAGVVPGGLASVLSGSGAGQWRRLTANHGNGTVELDMPFLTPLDGTSLVQLSDMRGRMIFDANRYTDGGAFQLYGNAYDVIVANSILTRATGEAVQPAARVSGESRSHPAPCTPAPCTLHPAYCILHTAHCITA